MPVPIQHTHIGGQAVLEGVMMRGKLNWAIAVRKPDGTIHLEDHDLKSASSRYSFLKWPVLRGVWGLYETMALAMKAFGISASVAGDPDSEDGEGGLTAGEVTLSMVLGVALAIGLFVVLPAVLTNLFGDLVKESHVAWNVIDGVLRLVVFFLYIWAVSRMKDIQRLFAYHGAEHKTIHAYEHGLPLETSVIQKYETLHVRCGTSFLLMVMVIAILVFSVVPAPTLLDKLIVRIVLLPIIAGLAYEVIKWAGRRPENPVVRVLLWPGLQLQRMTTREPSDDMVEIAVAAMRRVVERENPEALADLTFSDAPAASGASEAPETLETPAASEASETPDAPEAVVDVEGSERSHA